MEWIRTENTKQDLDYGHQLDCLLTTAEWEVFDIIRENPHAHHTIPDGLLQFQNFFFWPGFQDKRFVFGVEDVMECMRDIARSVLQDSWLAEWHLNRYALGMEQVGIFVPRQQLITEFFLVDDVFVEPWINRQVNRGKWLKVERSRKSHARQRRITEFFSRG